MKGSKTDKRGWITQTDADGNVLWEEEGLVVGRGDQKKVISTAQVAELAALHCTNVEIADFFGISDNTLSYNFKEVIKKAKAETKQRLRAAQLKHAIDGNATLLIWLGKNMLGQSDSQQEDNTVTVLPWTDDIQKAQVQEAYDNLDDKDDPNATE
jgi:hypothetical protein